MAIGALTWAVHINPKGVSDAALRTLAIMADSASSEGYLCWMSNTTLMGLRGVSRATLNRHINELHTAGLIAPGDPRVVSHLATNRRPRVWAVMAPVRGLIGETPGDVRGLTLDLPGVSPSEPTYIGRSVIDPSNSPSVPRSRGRASVGTQIRVITGYPGRECIHGFSADVHVNSRTGFTEPLCPICRKAGIVTPAPEEGHAHDDAA